VEEAREALRELGGVLGLRLVAPVPASLAAALRRLLATNARALVESRYDWEEIGGRFRGLVEETVRVHRSVKGGAP